MTSFADRVLDYACALPDAYLGVAFGYPAARIAYRNRVILFYRPPDQDNQVSLKLNESLADALCYSSVRLTGHGYGRAGWVTVDFSGPHPRFTTIRCWIDESHMLRSSD